MLTILFRIVCIDFYSIGSFVLDLMISVSFGRLF